MNYRQWQKRNTEYFHRLSNVDKRLLREKGYHNIGWQKVKDSWKILEKFLEPKSIFDKKLQKGDLLGAINQSILEADCAHRVASQAMYQQDQYQDEVNKIANNVLNKYPVL